MADSQWSAIGGQQLFDGRALICARRANGAGCMLKAARLRRVVFLFGLAFGGHC